MARIAKPGGIWNAPQYTFDSQSVHLTGNERIDGTKTFVRGPRWLKQLVTSTTTLISGSAAQVVADTTLSAFTVKLPAAPAEGEWFILQDAAGQWATRNVTLDPNGKKLDGSLLGVPLATANGSRRVIYDGTQWHTESYGNATLTSAPVSSVFGRTGAVVAQSGDYSIGQITGAVTSVFGRSAAVVATSGDYTAAQVTNAADKASASTQAFTGAITIGGAIANFGSTGLALQTGGTIWAAATLVGSSLFVGSVTGDAERRIGITAGGSILFGGGALATDLTIARLVTAGVTLVNVTSSGTQGISTGAIPNALTAAGWTTWSGVEEVIGSVAGNNVYVCGIVGETTFRHSVHADGSHLWAGSGGANDTTLERSAANTLRATNTGLLSTSPTVGLGYATGAGGAITQITSRTTAVTLNKVCGQITTNTTSLATGATAAFVVNNTTVAATDVIILNLTNAGAFTPLNFPYAIMAVGAGTFTIAYTNNTGSATVVAFIFNFSSVTAVNAGSKREGARMKTKILGYQVQTIFVQEDDDGEVINVIPMEAEDFRGANSLTMNAKEYVQRKRELCAQLTEQAEAEKPKPNRQARRSKGSK